MLGALLRLNPPPAVGVVRHADRSVPRSDFLNQGERIRTFDLVAPNHALYQAELRPGVVRRAANRNGVKCMPQESQNRHDEKDRP